MTVGECLEALQLPLVRISIRRKIPHSVEYLGGGYADSVIRRFGSMVIVDSNIIDNVLVIYVE